MSDPAATCHVARGLPFPRCVLHAARFPDLAIGLDMVRKPGPVPQQNGARASEVACYAAQAAR
jgi:hypothetical protein